MLRLLLLSFTLQYACTSGRYSVETPAVTVTQFPKLNKSRAVLLLPKDKVAETYVTKLGGSETVEFRNVRQVMETILVTKLKPVFKDLRVVETAADAGTYDYLIAPALTVRYKDILFRNRVLINFDIATFDSTGKALGEVQSYEGRTFGGDNGGEAFKLAMETVFDKTMDKMLTNLSGSHSKEPREDRPSAKK